LLEKGLRHGLCQLAIERLGDWVIGHLTQVMKMCAFFLYTHQWMHAACCKLPAIALKNIPFAHVYNRILW